VESAEPFPACRTDRLEDTVDAAVIVALLKRQAEESRVRTLEAIGALTEEALRARFPRSGLAWQLTIHKPRFGWRYVHSW
jgi:dihydroneopterin aldolase